MDKKFLDVYSDYLISSFSYTTATGLSAALDGQVSHDTITRLLSGDELDSKQLWLLVKPMVKCYECDDGVIVFDDTLEEKPYTKESELVCWHHDHTKNRSVKGINLLKCLYKTDEVSFPLGFDLVKKPIEFCDIKTRKRKRKSTTSKNELLRARLAVCQRNQIQVSLRIDRQLVFVQRKHGLYPARPGQALYHVTENQPYRGFDRGRQKTRRLYTD